MLVVKTADDWKRLFGEPAPSLGKPVEFVKIDGSKISAASAIFMFEDLELAKRERALGLR